MSMYEMLFPSAAPGLAGHTLDVMGIPPDNYRLRDTWVERDDDGQPVIRILTRLGGGNRDDFATQIRELQQHPLYIRDHDEDEWDRTYASFYYRIPASLPTTARAAFEAAAEAQPVNMKARAEAALEAASARWHRGEYTAAEAAMRDRMQKMIDEGAPGGIIEI